MEWSNKLRTLQRGLRLAIGVLKAKLEARRAPARGPVEQGRLVGFEGFGDNPGRLRMLAHLPAALPGRPLVVLLHGCGQDAAAFAADSGWIALADRLRFPLILPQQAGANNAARCFQWFHPADIMRDQGEAGSIAAMTRAAIERFQSDRRRVFIVGLSAGAAMAAALLAAYPDLFSAGAAVAGLPVGSATSGMQALLRMASAGMVHTPADWAAAVKAAIPSGSSGPWPRLSIWQGMADRTVAPDNADLLAAQWQALLDLRRQDMSECVIGSVRHQVWNLGREPVLETWKLDTLPHGYPVGSRPPHPGNFVQSSGVDATAEIAGFFGLD